MQGPGQRDVVHVVSGAAGERPVLPPAGHPRVHQGRIDRVAVVRPQAEALGDTGPHALEEDLRGAGQPQHHVAQRSVAAHRQSSIHVAKVSVSTDNAILFAPRLGAC